MNNRICDLHCDTLYNLRKIDGSLAKNQGHLSLEKLSEFESFLQVLAVWSEHKHTNKGYRLKSRAHKKRATE